MTNLLGLDDIASAAGEVTEQAKNVAGHMGWRRSTAGQQSAQPMPVEV